MAWNQSSPPPWGSIVPDRKLKLIIGNSGSNGQLTVVEGCVARVMKDHLLVDVETAISKQEDRVSFRQPVMKGAVIRLSGDEGPGDTCTIVDISASGIGLISRQAYEIGTKLEIKNLQLRDGGPIHSVFCELRRSREQSEKGYFYGCQFCDLTTDQEDALYGDLFTMQAQELRRRREQTNF